MVIINNKNSINYKDTGFLKYRDTSSEEFIVYETTDPFSKPSVNVSGLIRQVSHRKDFFIYLRNMGRSNNFVFQQDPITRFEPRSCQEP